jgi:hypothetical protein
LRIISNYRACLHPLSVLWSSNSGGFMDCYGQ